jgi:serine/threonine-protein kinase
VTVPHLEGFAPPPPPTGIPLRTLAYAIGGAGVVGVFLGSVFGGLTFAKKGAAGPHCSGMYCDAQGLSLQNAAHAYATASTTAFVLGLAAGSAGAFLFVWGGPERRLTLGVTPPLSASPGSPGLAMALRIERAW